MEPVSLDRIGGFASWGYGQLWSQKSPLGTPSLQKAARANQNLHLENQQSGYSKRQQFKKKLGGLEVLNSLRRRPKNRAFRGLCHGYPPHRRSVTKEKPRKIGVSVPLGAICNLPNSRGVFGHLQEMPLWGPYSGTHDVLVLKKARRPFTDRFGLIHITDWPSVTAPTFDGGRVARLFARIHLGQSGMIEIGRTSPKGKSPISPVQRLGSRTGPLARAPHNPKMGALSLFFARSPTEEKSDLSPPGPLRTPAKQDSRPAPIHPIARASSTIAEKMPSPRKQETPKNSPPAPYRPICRSGAPPAAGISRAHRLQRPENLRHAP